jgi:hypothetical protein
MNEKNTITTLHNLFFSENKAAELKPVDIALLTYLVLRQTEDHYIRDSQLTLANRLACSRDAIADSISRLEAIKWITVERPWQFSAKTKRKTRVIGRTVGLAINSDKLPSADDRATRSKPSQNAVHMASQHTALLVKRGLFRKQFKNFDRFQENAAQWLIDYLGTDIAFEILNFAMGDKRFQKAAFTSLYKIRSRLPAIKAAYDAARSAPEKNEQAA